jgi:hypothetical protein
VSFSHHGSGIVITDRALIVKADKQTLKKYNDKIEDKKDKKKSIYHFIKWEYFDIGEFEIKNEAGNSKLVLAGEEVLSLETLNAECFKNTYLDTIKKITKVSETSTSAVFSAEEAVFAENHAKIKTKTGHGEMAEEALTWLDKLFGKTAKVVGRDNAKNGPDRMVNGVSIQTKYYKTGSGCVNACFDKNTGMFRYYTKDGSPMLIEVPKDKYEAAVTAFRKKIAEGKVPGVTNPDDAEKYIKKGKLTYQQGLNLCKAGTIESLAYDTVTGIITCSFALGISFLVTYIFSFWQTNDKKIALNEALVAGVQVFGLSFLSHILASQVARTGLTKSLMPVSTYIVKKMGYKAAQNIVNAIRVLMGKGAISGAAATKSLEKMLRSNFITSAISFVAFSIPDTYRVFRQKISGAQFTKNILALLGGMVGTTGGIISTGLAVAKIGAITGTTVAPGVGTVIGLGGGLLGGIGVSTVTKIIGDAIREDDALIMARLFNGVIITLTFDYMLQQEEMDEVINKLNAIKQKEFKTLFMNAIAAKEQEKVMVNFAENLFIDVVKKRPPISEPSIDDLTEMMGQFNVSETDKMPRSSFPGICVARFRSIFAKKYAKNLWDTCPQQSQEKSA